jgi:HSP20 family molecular chaperone IbpA
VVPLPQGAIADSAKATFNNGVLEIVVQAPSFDVRRGRRVEIKEGASEQEPNQQNQKT